MSHVIQQFRHLSAPERQDTSSSIAMYSFLCYDMKQRGDHVKISMQIDDVYEDTEIIIRREAMENLKLAEALDKYKTTV